MKLWEIDIYPLDGNPDRLASDVLQATEDLNLEFEVDVAAARSFLIQGELEREDISKIADSLLTDPVIERAVVAEIGDPSLQQSPNGKSLVAHVLPLPGVTDPVAESALRAIKNLKFDADAVCTMKKFWLSELNQDQLASLTRKILANDSIEQVVVGPLELDQLNAGTPYQFEQHTVDLLAADDEQLMSISKSNQLSLTLIEMQTIKEHFVQAGRNPTDIELETVAQTWSEHCSHKTLAGRVNYHDENGQRQFDNMLKETIFAATQEIRKSLGDQDWCVSVFKDNAGIVTFDDQFNIAFKVETHNRPSALEPYGGANTGIGGVIRDTLGTGMGAKPIANTDVFCFAPPETDASEIPTGVLHPRRVMKGVVSGVRDYGNRMGIPTVNGAIYFDDRYIGNPLVFCGNVGILPKEMSFKEPNPGDMIVSIGGKTGRDGIHGATFSSAELTSESDVLSGGAVQIGNAITEKMVMDVILQARDLGLYSAITDCGAGGFSSAVGEMGEEIGAEVWLEKAPLKYSGLTYTEIWISEAQERMVCSVPPEKCEEFIALCAAESVEATVIGKFVPNGRLVLKYEDQIVGDMSMAFLHDGRPKVIREATFQPLAETPLEFDSSNVDLSKSLMSVLGSLNVASKEWVIRQYDHEVQGGSVLKPLVGKDQDGPGNAAVVRPVFGSRRGVVISCGMNPYYGDLDPYWMAASGIDEAMRNCVAVGADPSRIALLDNFCWGYTDRPETLGSLVRAALACYDSAVELKTPFISGKDSLNNEFSYKDDQGNQQTISIPSTLLISAMGQIPSIDNCVTMDFKKAGNLIYILGETKNELGGSHFALVNQLTGGAVPKVDVKNSKQIFESTFAAISGGMVRSCHDLSEGGLAVALAEMAFAGGLGADVDVSAIVNESAGVDTTVALFSESNTRFLFEVAPEKASQFEAEMSQHCCLKIGQVTESGSLKIASGTTTPIDAQIASLKESWQAPLNW